VRFAERFATRERVLDLLVANAANMPYTKKPELTENGLEKTFATNHLGHFLLVTKLLPSLEGAAGETGEAHVVVVSSRLHQPKSIGPEVRFDFSDPNLTHRYHPMVAYKNSKLANLWFTYELNRRLDGTGITANALCPGFVPATIADEARGLRRFRFKHILSRLPFARTPTEATDTYLFVGAHPSLKGVGGKFFAEGRQIRSSLESYDEDKAAWLWALSEQLVDLA
jgi:NAD(P)-dependent dehydrogenase (short-subunit alcohol dehydrogenase family)